MAREFVAASDKDSFPPSGIKRLCGIRLDRSGKRVIMRKKVASGFVLLSIVTVASGLYIMFHIERASTQLKNLLTSHQAEIIRWNLIERINQVQFDFFLIDT